MVASLISFLFSLLLLSPMVQGPFPTRSIDSPASAGSLKNAAVKSSLDCQAPVLMIDECLSPTSLDSVVVAERDSKSDRFRNPGPIGSSDCIEADQVGAHPCTRYCRPSKTLCSSMDPCFCFCPLSCCSRPACASADAGRSSGWARR